MDQLDDASLGSHSEDSTSSQASSNSSVNKYSKRWMSSSTKKMITLLVLIFGFAIGLLLDPCGRKMIWERSKSTAVGSQQTSTQHSMLRHDNNNNNNNDANNNQLVQGQPHVQREEEEREPIDYSLYFTPEEEAAIHWDKPPCSYPNYTSTSLNATCAPRFLIVGAMKCGT